MKWEMHLARGELNPKRAELDIYDAVGDPWNGVTSKAVLWSLRNMDVDEILVRVNSLGGVVSEGFDIYNLLKEHPAKVTCRISGIAASIASIVALAGDSVEMYSNSQYMIHDPYAQFDFGAPPMREADLRRSADLLNSLKDQMYAIYCSKTGMLKEEIAKLCAAESWFSAEKAKELGFIDRVLTGGESEMLTARASASEKAWRGLAKREPNLFASYRNLPQFIRIAAQAEDPQPTANLTTTQEKPKMRRKLNRVALASATSQGSLVAILTSLSEVLAKAKSKSEDFSAEELEDLRSALEASTAQAEELEEQAKLAKKYAEDFEKTKTDLDAANSRATKAGEELEDVKKKLAELKNASKAEDDEGDEEDDKEMTAEQKALFASASRKSLKSLARAVMALTKNKNFSTLEGSLLALEEKVQNIPDQTKVRAQFVDHLVAGGQLPPAKKEWALKASEDNLNAYLEGKGLAKFSAAFVPGAKAAQSHNNSTPGSSLGETIIKAPSDNDVLPNGLTRAEDKVRIQMRLTPEQVIAARSTTIAGGHNAPLELSFT